MQGLNSLYQKYFLINSMRSISGSGRVDSKKYNEFLKQKQKIKCKKKSSNFFYMVAR